MRTWLVILVLALEHAAAALVAEAGVVATHETVLASTNSFGQPGNASSGFSRLASGGRFAVFMSHATNLALGDTGNSDVFVHDLETGATKLASRTSTGLPGNGHSTEPEVSANGRFVAFLSTASNLVPEDTNEMADVFLFDRKHETVSRVSVASDGTQSDADSITPAISANGRFVAFASAATNLVAMDTNQKQDVFVHDRKTGKTERVSVATGGVESDGYSRRPALSASGRFVAFYSEVDTLDASDALSGVFVHDRKNETTERVSLSPSAEPIFSVSSEPCSISANGRVVMFMSDWNGIVPEDQNGLWDVFIRDRKQGTTTRVSVSNAGADAGAGCMMAQLSGNGRYVSFDSAGAGLVPGDTNGATDVFVHDRKQGTTVRVSLGVGGVQASASCFRSTLSDDGRTVLFESYANNLVSPGTTGTQVFARGL